MRLRLTPLFLFIGVILFFNCTSIADISRLRIIGMGGLGQALVTAKNGQYSFESPFGFSANIDYMMNSRFDLGAEHMRSLSSNGSTVGFTGLTVKYFFWFQHPQILQESSKNVDNPVIQIKVWSPYLGTSIGVAQGSILDTKISAVGFYTNFKGGLDYPISNSWGARLESNFGFAFGTGTIRMMNGLIGFYCYL